MTDTPQCDPADTGPLVSTMQEAGYASQPVMLAIPSQWCLPASVVLASRGLTRNRQAVAFAVEEQLPLSAEEMVNDYIAHQSDVFSVAADVATLVPVVQSLEQAGVTVSTITPAALLLLQRLEREHRLPSGGLLLLADAEDCEFFVLAGSRPRQWRCISADGDAVRREVGAWLLSRMDEQDGPPLSITATNLSDATTSSLRTLEPEVAVADEQLDVESALLEEAGNVLTKGRRPWIELRRDEVGEYDPYGLVRGSMNLLLLSALVMLVCLATAAWWRGSRYEALADEIESQKRAIFQELFPDARVPAGIRSRLESERRKLMGLGGGDRQLAEVESVTGFLVDVLAGLPDDLRFRLLEMRFEEQSGYLDGEARRYGDVDTIAMSLRARGYVVDPPHTEHLAGEGVSFALTITAPPTEQRGE